MFRDILQRQLDPRRFRQPGLGHPSFVKGLRLSARLEKHGGCVNAVSWNEDASYLISGSDDLCVCVWSMGTGFPLKGSVFTGHRHNIFSVEFVPSSDSGKCVTTAGDGDVRLVDLVRGFQERQPFQHDRYETMRADSPAASSLWNSYGSGMGMKVAFIPGSSHAFLTTHQDGLVRLFDIRSPPGGNQETIIDLSHVGSTSDIAFNPLSPSMFTIGCDDTIVRLFDLRHVNSTRRRMSPSERDNDGMVPTVAQYTPFGSGSSHYKFDGISGLAFSRKGELAVTYRGEDVYVFDNHVMQSGGDTISHDLECADNDSKHVRAYKGRKNTNTFLKGVAFLCEDKYVGTGGDCGSMFIWDKLTCELVLQIRADGQVVNNVCPHPHLPVIATSGIDDDIKIWEAGEGHHCQQLPEQETSSDSFIDFAESDEDESDEDDMWEGACPESDEDEDEDEQQNEQEDDDVAQDAVEERAS